MLGKDLLQDKKDPVEDQSKNPYWFLDDAYKTGDGEIWWDQGYIANRISNNIVNRVNTYLENHNHFVKNHETRYKDRMFTIEDEYVDDCYYWLKTLETQNNKFKDEAASILGYMDQYKDYLDEKWMSEVRNTLSTAGETQEKVIDYSLKDFEYWQSFADDPMYKQYGSAEEVYKYYQRLHSYQKKYAGMNATEIANALGGLEDGEERQWLQYHQGAVHGDYLRNQADFQTYSNMGTGLSYSDLGDTNLRVLAEAPSHAGIAALIAMANHYGTESPNYSEDLEDSVALFKTMEEEEFQILAYCLAKDKENGSFYTLGTDNRPIFNKASLTWQYISTMEKVLQQRRSEEIANLYKNTPVVADLYAVRVGLSNFSDGIKDAMGLDSYGSGTTQMAGSIIRDSFADDGFKLPDWLGGASGRQLLFDFTSTVSNQIPTIAVSYMLGGTPTLGKIAGTGLMGISAAGNAYSEAMDKGWSKGEATLYATGIGALEASLQYGLGGISKLGGVGPKITNAVSGINNALARFSLQYGGKIMAEGLEEGLQEILDPLLQSVIHGTDADVNWEEVTYSALLGGLSAGALEVSGTVHDVRHQTAINKGTVAQYGAYATDLVTKGLASDPDSSIHKLAKKYQNKLNAGKNLTASQITQVLKAETETRLSALGESKNTSTIAELATKYATGQEMSKAERTTLAKSQYGAQVVKELELNARNYNPKAQPDAVYRPLEERVDKVYATSESGKTVLQETGGEVSVAEVLEVGNGKMKVRLEDGQTVDASEIDFADDSMSYLMSAVARIENITPKAATAIIRDYDPSSGQTVGKYLNGVDEAFTYGYHGYSQADLNAGDFTGKLTDVQKKSAYVMGQEARKHTDSSKAETQKKMRTAAEVEAEKADQSPKTEKKAEKKKQPTITYNSGNGKVVEFDKAGVKLTDKQSGAVRVAKILHRLGLGTRFEFFSSYLNKDGVRVFLNDKGVEQKAYSGLYRMSDGTIRIDLNAYNGKGLTLNAMSHELTHFMQQWSVEKYKALADFLIKTYEKTDMTMHKRVLREQNRLEDIRGEKVSYDEAFDEVVANAMSKMLDDGKIVEKLTKLREQDKQLAQKLWEGFKKILAKFTGIYKKESALFHDTADLMEMKNSFEHLQELFAQALVEASDNYRASLTAAESQKFGDRYASQETDVDTDQKVIYHKEKNQEVVGNERREETRETFIRRASKTLPEVTERGALAFGFRRFPGQLLQNIRKAEKGLKKLGIPVVVFEQLEGNKNGYTTIFRSDGVAIPGVAVFINHNTTADALEIVGHEGYHYLATLGNRVIYNEVLAGNIDFSSKAFIDYQQKYVDDNYFAEDVEVGSKEWNSFMEEIFAYITGHIHAGDPKGEVHQFLRDYDAVRAAWNDLLEKQTADSLYSGHEADVDTNAKPYSYDALISKPDMVITTVDSNVPKNRADVVYQAKQNAAKVGKFDPKTGSVSVHVDDIGVDVVLGTPGLKHGLEPRRTENAIVTLRAGEILKHSIRINELTPKKEQVDGSYVLIGAAESSDGTLYVVRSVVNQVSHKLISMDVLYAINAKKGNRLRSMRPGFQGPVADSTISIADLLDLVNQYFPDVLPEDVLKHYGYEARPEGDLGKDALYSGHETDADSISVNDIVTMGNGRLAVSIDSKISGLHGHRKGEWPTLVSRMIRKTLSGKSIVAADGDIITVTRRGANEVGFGTDTKKMRAEAQTSNDYSKVEQKMIAAEHAASIIALSRYSSWSRNTEDTSDMFKRDGLNYRTVEMFIDGDPYTATVITALNTDATDTKNYGEKFYDIESIEKQTNSPASYGAPITGTNPHKIKMADSSSDRLTIAQKKRIVKRQNAAYSTGDFGTKTAMAEAFAQAKELKSGHETDNISNRDLLANAFESITKSSPEYELIQEYKGHISDLNALEKNLNNLNAQILEIRFTKGKYDAKKLAELENKAEIIVGEIYRHDRKLLSLEASEPLREVIQRGRKKEAQKTREHIKEIQQNKKAEAERRYLRFGVHADDSTGAAPSGFDPVSHLQYEYGSLPEGEKPVREDSLPKSTNGKDNVSLTARTVKGAKATPDALVDLLDKTVVEGGLSYIPLSNDATVQKAYDRIKDLGWEDALADWKADVRAGKVSAELSATGALLLNNAANAGDRAAWLDVLHEYQRMGTSAAQAVQALRILKTLAPEDKLYMIHKSVEQMNKDSGYDVEVDEDLLHEWDKAETDTERDEVLDAIMQNVADQIPSTFMEKFTALRYVNMLGNLRTQVRNVAGNLSMKGVRSIHNTIATGLEAIVNIVSGGKTGRTRTITVNKEQKVAAKQDFEKLKSVILDGGKYSDSVDASTEFAKGVQEKRKIFKFKPLEGYRKATNWAMEQGDLIFAKSSYARALAGYLKANGITETDYSKIDTKVLDDARLFAIKEAQEATFRDTNALSGWISKMGRRKDTHKVGKLISEGVMPFRKTPANVLIRAEEYSPLGVINSVYYSVKAMQKGSDVTAAQVINSWAKSLTGTGLFALGMLLQSVGCLAGGADDDESKDKFDSMNGWQNYAIVLPDGTNLTIDFLTPTAMPMLMGAELSQLMADGGFELKDLESALTSITEPMVQMSMLQGINDTLDNVKYSESSLGQLLINASLSYLTQGFTNTFLGQIERSFEDSRTTTYVDNDSPVPDWLQKTLGKMSAKIPGLDYNQVPYINAWGEEEKNGNIMGNLAYNMLSPSYVDKGENDAVSKELNRLNEVNETGRTVFPSTPEKKITFTDSSGAKHKNYDLTADEYVALAKEQGQTQRQIVESMLQSELYADLSDKNKAKAVQTAYDYAREYAQIQVLDRDGFSSQWMVELEGNIADGILRHVTEGSIKESFLNGDITAGKAVQMRMEYSGDSAEEAAEKVAYWGFQDDNPKYADLSQSAVIHWYDEAEPAGISLDVYYDFMKKKAQCKGVDSDGDGKADRGSVRTEVIDLIASIEGLTYAQRLVLKEIAGYK